MIYGLQVAMRALEPPPVPRSQTTTAAQPISEPQPAADTADSTSTTGPTSGPATQLATNNQQLATAPPRTIPIAKESLLYFLRSRHCATCNAELFPASKLTERRNPGAPPEIIEESNPRLPAPQPATDNLQPATVLLTLDAVAADPTSNLEPGTPQFTRTRPLCFTLT